jgi:hypothetical protein
MLTAQPLSMPLRQCLNVIMTRWQKLMRIAAYRPELHYMRGPGPEMARQAPSPRRMQPALRGGPGWGILG